MATIIPFIFEVVDRFSRTADRIRRGIRRLRDRIRDTDNAFSRASRAVINFGRRLQGVGRSISKVGGTLTKNVTLPLGALGTASLVQSAKFESLGIAFEVLIGDAKKAKKVLNDLTHFTATTPFQMEGVANSAKMLLSVGVNAKDIIPTLRQLGELAAGTGRPLEEFSLIFGKILGKGKVQGDELLQLAEKGISLQTILADKFNVSGEVIVDAVSKGQISFKIFKEALEDLTSEGGKFFRLTERQSRSLGGLFSTLKDAGVLAFKEIGDTIVREMKLKEVLVDVITLIQRATASFVKFTKNNPRLTKFLVIMVGILAILGPVLSIIGPMVIAFGALAIAAGFLGVSMAALTLPMLAIIGTAALVIAATVAIISNWDDMVSGGKLLFNDLKKVFTDFAEFISQKTEAVRDTLSVLFEPLKQTLNFAMGGTLGKKLSPDKAISKNSGKLSEPLLKSSPLDIFQNSKTDINVSLRAPQGVIESVKSNTTGKPSGLNVGVNMATAL